MNEKQRILAELDKAIDEMNGEGIDRGLDALQTLEPQPVAEEPSLFAARMIQLEKENTQMKHSRKTMVAVVAAAAVMLMGVTVYAASALNLFSFPTGDGMFVTMRTNDAEMTEEEARALVEDKDAQAGGAGEQAERESFTFATVREAEEALAVPVALPEGFPTLELSDVTGQKLVFGDDFEIRTIWVNYGGIDEGKALGVTVERQIMASGAEVTAYTGAEMDEGSLDAYTSKDGTRFTLFTESDPTGELTAHMATAMVGEYEYALVLFGFDESEQKQLLDSLDLSVYR